jgi:hypothetical protein
MRWSVLLALIGLICDSPARAAPESGAVPDVHAARAQVQVLLTKASAGHALRPDDLKTLDGAFRVMRSTAAERASSMQLVMSFFSGRARQSLLRATDPGKTLMTWNSALTTLSFLGYGDKDAGKFIGDICARKLPAELTRGVSELHRRGLERSWRAQCLSARVCFERSSMAAEVASIVEEDSAPWMRKAAVGHLRSVVQHGGTTAVLDGLKVKPEDRPGAARLILWAYAVIGTPEAAARVDQIGADSPSLLGESGRLSEKMRRGENLSFYDGCYDPVGHEGVEASTPPVKP